MPNTQQPPSQHAILFFALLVLLCSFVAGIALLSLDSQAYHLSSSSSSSAITSDFYGSSFQNETQQASAAAPLSFLLDRDPFAYQHYFACFLMRLLVVPNTWACIALVLLWECFEEAVVTAMRIVMQNSPAVREGSGSFVSLMAGWMYESEEGKLLGDLYSDMLGIALACFVLYMCKRFAEADRRQFYVWYKGWKRHPRARSTIVLSSIVVSTFYVFTCMMGSLAVLEHPLTTPLRLPRFLTLGGMLPETVSTVAVGHAIWPFAACLALFIMYGIYYALVVPLTLLAQDDWHE
jgi:hypothetical protein